MSHNDIAKQTLNDGRIAQVGTEVGHDTMTLATTYMSEIFFKSYAPGSAIGQPSTALPIRHPTAHGDKTQGSRLETLACFLLLDVIVAILAGLRKLRLIP